MIIWEEHHRTIACGKKDKVDAASSTTRMMKPNSRMDKSTMFCIVCTEQGHDT